MASVENITRKHGKLNLPNRLKKKSREHVKGPHFKQMTTDTDSSVMSRFSKTMTCVMRLVKTCTPTCRIQKFFGFDSTYLHVASS